MKRILLVIMICAAIFSTNAQAVVKGTRVPQLTIRQRNTISDIDLINAKGQVIYNMDNNCLEYWNGIKWVSLCLGSANITLTGNPAGCNSTTLIPASGIQANCKYTPTDNPACVVSSGQAYQAYLTAGSSYASLQVDELTSAFSIKFSNNNSNNNRIAVVRVVNNCSGEFQDFPFIQEGATCPSAADPVVVTSSSSLCAGGSTYVYVSNAQTNVDYVWEYGGIIVHTGNYMEIKRSGVYTVYAGLLGCGKGKSLTITADAAQAPSPVVVSASNSSMICGATGAVVLTANPSPAGTNSIVWYHEGVPYGTTGISVSVTGQTAAGEWSAVQTTTGKCSSLISNTLKINYNSSASSLAVPSVTINGQSMGGTITICKKGTLELKVNNSYPAGTIFEWFDNGISISKSDKPVFYTVAPDRNEMTISLEVSSSAGGCPVSAASQRTNITMSAPASTTINNGASKTSICGSGEATLAARNSSGTTYQWLLNGAAVDGAAEATYKTKIPGSYAVRYKDAAGCWSITSANIAVEANAAVALSWLGGTPAASETYPNDKTYSVIAIPAAESFTWNSSNTSIASITSIGNGQSATVNYKAAGNVIITVTSTDNGCGSSSSSLPVSVISGCAPVLSLTLNPSDTPPINKYVNSDGTYQSTSDGYTNFSVTANGGATPTGYQWYVDDAEQTGATASAFKYTTPTTGTQDKVVKVTVENGCTPSFSDQSGISAQAIVHIIKAAAEDKSGTYRLIGKTCFDLARGNDDGTCEPLSIRTNDFASDNPSQTYTFAPAGSATYSNLIFVVNDPNGLIASSTTAIAGGATSNPSTLTVVFDKNAVINKAGGATKTTALPVTIIAMYKDNTNDDKQISLTLSIQDCSCGCSVKKAGGGYLTFLCYNLGVAEATKSMSPTQQATTLSSTSNDVKDNTIYGDLYQWGRWADRHEKRTSTSVSGGSSILAKNYDDNSQVKSSDTWYGKFVYLLGGAYDWHGNSTSPAPVFKNDNLWNFSVYPANNPCPKGWRIPTQSEWNSILQGSVDVNNIPAAGQSMSNSGNYWKWNPASNGTAGWLVSPDGGVNYTLFLPAAGSRGASSGKLSNAGSNGAYWSTSPDKNSLIFDNNSVTTNKNNYRAEGYSVRCVSE